MKAGFVSINWSLASGHAREKKQHSRRARHDQQSRAVVAKLRWWLLWSELAKEWDRYSVGTGFFNFDALMLRSRTRYRRRHFVATQTQPSVSSTHKGSQDGDTSS